MISDITGWYQHVISQPPPHISRPDPCTAVWPVIQPPSNSHQQQQQHNGISNVNHYYNFIPQIPYYPPTPASDAHTLKADTLRLLDEQVQFCHYIHPQHQHQQQHYCLSAVSPRVGSSSGVISDNTNNNNNNNNNNSKALMSTEAVNSLLMEMTRISPHTIGDVAKERCLMCGRLGHTHLSCPRYKTANGNGNGNNGGSFLCIFSEHDASVYLMQWYRESRLQDVVRFIESKMHVPRSLFEVWIGETRIELTQNEEDALYDVRCTALGIDPAVIVYVALRGRWRPHSSHNNHEEEESPMINYVIHQQQQQHASSASAASPSAANSLAIPFLAAAAGQHQHQQPQTVLPLMVFPADTTLPLSADSVMNISAISAPSVSYISHANTAATDCSHGINDVSNAAAAAAAEQQQQQQQLQLPPSLCGVQLHPDAVAALPATEWEKSVERMQPSYRTLTARCSRTLHVKFIPPSMEASVLRALFTQFGEVHRIRVVQPQPRHVRDPSKAFCMGFVEYASRAEAAVAKKALHEKKMAKRNFSLTVDYSTACIKDAMEDDFDAVTQRPCTYGISAADKACIRCLYVSNRRKDSL